MKKIILDSFRSGMLFTMIMLLTVTLANGSARKDINKENQVKIPETAANFQKKIYDKVDVMPVYPGGDPALIEFLARNIKYPEAAKKNAIQGVVMIRFCVTDIGSVDNIQVVKGVEKSLDDESVRVVGLLKGWTPAKLKGESVNVWYTLPRSFKLQ
jgi:TonB family protein